MYAYSEIYTTQSLPIFVFGYQFEHRFGGEEAIHVNSCIYKRLHMALLSHIQRYVLHLINYTDTFKSFR